MKFEKEVFLMKFYRNSEYVGVGVNTQGLDDALPREKIASVMLPWRGETLPKDWAERVTWIQLYVSENGQKEMMEYCMQEYDMKPEKPGVAQFLLR